MAGRGLWAAGSFAVRAITNAAALELREEGIQVTLLIVDAGIEPPSGPYPGTQREALADPRQIAMAVAFLARSGRARRQPRAGPHAAGRALGALRKAVMAPETC